MDREMKIGFVASSGGHWEELLTLYDISKDFKTFFVTEEGGQAKESAIQNLYIHPQINRHEKTFLLKFIRLWRTANTIFRKEKPDVIITTGALIAFPYCILAKLHRVKVIYVESFARIHDRSLTGRLVYPFADQFFVQWKSMLKCYPKAIYIGKLL